MKFLLLFCSLGLASVSIAFGASKSGAKKIELPHPFYWAVPDPLRGDWAGASDPVPDKTNEEGPVRRGPEPVERGEGGYVAQVIRADDRLLSVDNQLPDASDEGKYQANIFRKFNVANDVPVVVLQGVKSGKTINFTGDGWTGTIEDGHFKAGKGAEAFDLQHVERTPPTLGAKPPAGALVLFDGTNLDAWARRQDKDWLKEDGPPRWPMLNDGSMEVVPYSGYLITHKWFSDYKLHVEFRTLGGPTNSGVYLETRYEANINEVYGKLDGNACAQFDNCTEKSSNPGIRCSRPPLEWQTMDIDFHAPKFGPDGSKIASARATVYFNGVLYYNDQPIGPPKLNAARLGEAPTGPIMLQEHGMPVQFRNIWLVETGPSGGPPSNEK